MKTMIIVDFSWVLHRYYFGFKDHFIKKDGISEPIFKGGILGFSLLAERLVKKYPKAKIVFCMDGECTKKQLNADYKAQRDKSKKEQIYYDTSNIVDLLSNVSNIYFAKSETHEADDLISNLAFKFKENFDEIIIYSGDKDFFQLCNDFKVSNEYEKGFKFITPNKVFEKFGVTVDALLGFRVLDGDTSDNLKAPVPFIKTEFKKEIAEKWIDLEIDTFTDIMYSYKGTKWEKSAFKYLEAIDKVETNLQIMNLKKYKNEDVRFKYNMFKCTNPNKELINYFELRQFECFLYDYFKENKVNV